MTWPRSSRTRSAQKLAHVEVLTHLEPIEDPKSWDDPGKPLAGT